MSARAAPGGPEGLSVMAEVLTAHLGGAFDKPVTPAGIEE